MKIPLADKTVKMVLSRVLDSRPELIGDEKFPVVCLKCGYSLVGSTCGRCPECGTLFDRADLLFEQYELGRSLDARERASSRAGRTPAVKLLFVCVYSSFFVRLLDGILEDYTGAGIRIPHWRQVVVGVMLLAVMLLVVILIQERIRWRRLRVRRDELMGIVEAAWDMP